MITVPGLGKLGLGEEERTKLLIKLKKTNLRYFCKHV